MYLVRVEIIMLSECVVYKKSLIRKDNGHDAQAGSRIDLVQGRLSSRQIKIVAKFQ